MEADEIRQKFQSTIDEAVSAAGAKLDGTVKDILSQLTFGAARETERLDEFTQERAIDEGVAAYQKLAAKLVAAAKTYSMFPEVNKHAWDLALMQLGPNPPFYF
jgi:hypothetical protein